MPLISCPECAKEISRQAKVCPSCGYPSPGSASPQEKEKFKLESLKLESSITGEKELVSLGLLKEVPRKSSLFKKLGELGKALSDDAGQLKETYEESDIKKKLDDAVVSSKDYLDEKGMTEKALKAYEASQDHFDTVSGKKILQMVEERMELQAKYNDILATKLHEALQRIDELERSLGSKEI